MILLMKLLIKLHHFLKLNGEWIRFVNLGDINVNLATLKKRPNNCHTSTTSNDIYQS